MIGEHIALEFLFLRILVDLYSGQRIFLVSVVSTFCAASKRASLESTAAFDLGR